MSTTYHLTLFPARVLAQFKSTDDIPDLNFEIDFVEFANGLKRLWSNVFLNIGELDIEWELKDEDGSISGTLDHLHMVTVKPGSIRRIVEFVNWYRDLVPSQYTIYMFHLGQPDGIVIGGGKHIKDVDLERL